MENPKIKIFVGIMLFLALLSLIFLATSKKKNTQTVKNQTVATQPKAVAKSQPNTNKAAPIKNQSANNNTPAASTAPKMTAEQFLAAMKTQWQNCKSGNFDTTKTFVWKIQITEAIPQGGTYAKGFIGGDQAYPVHAIIKSDSQIKEKINAMLVVGKDALLRGTCTQVASDGSVVLEVF